MRVMQSFLLLLLHRRRLVVLDMTKEKRCGGTVLQLLLRLVLFVGAYFVVPSDGDVIEERRRRAPSSVKTTKTWIQQLWHWYCRCRMSLLGLVYDSVVASKQPGKEKLVHRVGGEGKSLVLDETPTRQIAARLPWKDVVQAWDVRKTTMTWVQSVRSDAVSQVCSVFVSTTLLQQRTK